MLNFRLLSQKMNSDGKFLVYFYSEIKEEYFQVMREAAEKQKIEWFSFDLTKNDLIPKMKTIFKKRPQKDYIVQLFIHDGGNYFDMEFL